MIAALVQARMSSTRLPGKVLADLCGKPMLWHLLERLKYSRSPEKIIVTTSDSAEDQAIMRLAESAGVAVFAGSLDNVTDRFYEAAKKFEVDIIVRITGDCPLVDPYVIDKVVAHFFSGDYDYAGNVNPPTYPDGLDVEVFTFAALRRTWREASLPWEFEHPNRYILDHPSLFRIGNVENEVDLSGLRWCVDDACDLEFVRAIYCRLGKGNRIFGMQEILDLLAREPELKRINAGAERNEGYLKARREYEAAYGMSQ